MNQTCKTWLLGLAASAALSLAGTTANAVSVNFSFTGGGGSVAGYLSGLSDNATGAASGIYLTSVTPTLGTGWGLNQNLLVMAGVFANSVTLLNGAATAVAIDIYGPINDLAGQRLTLDLFIPEDVDIGTPASYYTRFTNITVSHTLLTTTPNVTYAVQSAAPTDTPEPASFALLGAALVGFAARRRRSA